MLPPFPHLNCAKRVYLCHSEERWEQKWVMLGISASSWQGITPPILAGTIHTHHVQRWVALQSDYCLPASFCEQCTRFHCWYPLNTHVILLSQLVRVTGLKPPARIRLCYWMQWAISKSVTKQLDASLVALFVGIVAPESRLNSATLECTLPHFHIFFSSCCASTLKKHINHAPREVTVNEVPTVADKMKLEHWFPWVLLRCPSGRAPWFFIRLQ